MTSSLKSRSSSPRANVRHLEGLTRHEKVRLLELMKERDRRAEIERMLGDFRYYVECAWPLVESVQFVPGFHIDGICEHLEALFYREIRKLLINIPPRCAKSLLCSVLFPTWIWAKMASERFMCVSYAEHLSLRDAVKSRRLIQSDWYQDCFGDRFSLMGDQNAKHYYQNSQGGERLSTSIEGITTGAGGDMILVDDPHNVTKVESEADRKKVEEWWKGAMPTRDNDMNRSARLIIMQRVHEKDLSGIVLEEGGWEHLKLPAEYNPNKSCVTSLGWMDPRTEDKQLLCPERISRESTNELRRILGPYRASGQLDQEPAPLDGGLVKRSQFKRYSAKSKPAEFDYVLLSVDCSFDKDGTDPSYAVVQAWGLFGIRKYLIHQAREFMNINETREVVWSFYREYQPNETLVEKKANGAAIITTFSEVIPGIIPVVPKDSKISRFVAITPEIIAGNYYIPEDADAPWAEGFISELCTFPNSSHDDQVDATSQAALRLRTMCEALTGEPNPATVPKHSVWQNMGPMAIQYGDA